MNILYIEDNIESRYLVERIAHLNKHQLFAYEEAETALTLLEQGLGVDLIMTDLQPAGYMDGISFIKELRQRQFAQPVIAMTADSSQRQAQRVLQMGCEAYLPKPIPVTELVDLMDRFDPYRRQLA